MHKRIRAGAPSPRRSAGRSTAGRTGAPLPRRSAPVISAILGMLLILSFPVSAGSSYNRRAVPGLDTLPGPVENNIRRDIKRFLWMLRPVLHEPEELLVPVDPDRPLDRDRRPADLVELSREHPELSLRRNDLRMTRRAARALARMARSARDDGVELVISSTYRSYDEQEELHEYWRQTLGDEQASRVSARAGHSQHQLGTTVDFAPVGRQFDGTAADRWLSEHAWKFGFSLSYPKDFEEITGYSHESWHYRYIGRPAAALEQRYFDGVQQYMLAFLHSFRDELEQWSGVPGVVGDRLPGYGPESRIESE
ncbi:MAG: M15 family metallopeptidase [Spirochaetota bacterium]